uniref:RNA-directed DNA polymerase, eukaryota, reverse transcriptase zinc-binding domain protein n=1 Tax=Tanacetum cinerariifolium TaxID=118510 RepID=A0A699HCY2_TANCI|nr:hypothetical protein [Tanacetum cinerariifolium]
MFIVFPLFFDMSHQALHNAISSAVVHGRDLGVLFLINLKYVLLVSTEIDGCEPRAVGVYKGRQILDGPLILNEVVGWCKARNEQALMKWRGRIHGCLHSSKASVLVNGSPTDEFSFHRGLSLKTNVNKSSLFGLGIQSSDIHLMADHFGCLVNKLPFTYLGVKVGASMSRHSSWLEVVQKVN